MEDFLIWSAAETQAAGKATRGRHNAEDPRPPTLKMENQETKKESQDIKERIQMLGQIAAIVADHCESDEDTTLLAVARLRAKYLDLECRLAWEFVASLEQKKE